MSSPHVYDKAKYHLDSVEQLGLSEEHAANHTAFFLRWLIEHDLMSEFFITESEGIVANFLNGNTSIHDVYEWWDCCLIEDMLSDEGNAFAMHYFDFEHGLYLQDYISILQRELPTEFHVDYSEENYHVLRKVIDLRYAQWKTPKRRWWPFGREK